MEKSLCQPRKKRRKSVAQKRKYHYKKPINESIDHVSVADSQLSSMPDLKTDFESEVCTNQHVVNPNKQTRKRRYKKIASYRKYHYSHSKASSSSLNKPCNQDFTAPDSIVDVLAEPQKSQCEISSTDSTVGDTCCSVLDNQLWVTDFLSESTEYENKLIKTEETDTEGHSANQFIVILDKPYVYDPAIDIDELFSVIFVMM
ncbi:uncharacterized protein [Ptychodera flava]|uniref:uncharacterized protein n=1 Tax=Ptychodera flava TaxID=63121 RepID=UPI00396A5FD7